MQSTQCPSCKNLIMTEEYLVCNAFIEEIPEEILTGEYDHTKPYKGDNGIQFEPIEDD